MHHPNPPHFRFLLKYALFAVLPMACSPGVSASVSAADLPPVEETNSPTIAYARAQEVAAQARTLIKAQDTAGLETLAAELRKNRECLDSGTWILSTFYKAAVQIPNKEPAASQAMEFFERWSRERPDNITAQVCLVRALAGHAWTARGGGWADSVTEEGWRLFRERLARANEILERAGQLDEKCPGLFEAGQTVALGQGWSREKYMDKVSEAIRAEPTYGSYYTNACYWLLPRWYGEAGDFETWIARQADASPLDQRDRQYAFFVWMADRMPVDGEIVFAPGRLDWERTKRGFEHWLKEHPENLMVRLEFLRMALLADDRPTAREQFKTTGGKYFPPLWKDRDQFEQARRFAFENGPNPLQHIKKAHSNPRFQPKTIAMVKTISKAVGGLIGGALAGVCLLILSIPFRQIGAGVVALVACLLLGPLLGTVITLLPAVALLLYLRRKLPVQPPESAPPSGWMVLLWVIVLSAIYVVLQLGASVLAFLPLMLDHGFSSGEAVARLATSDGTVLVICLNAAWIGFLGLLIVCRPRYRDGWKNRMGLHQCPPIKGLLWSSVALLSVLALGLILERFMDERSRSAFALIALGLNSPASFYLAIALAAPAFEELLFRGYAYSGWIDKIGFWGTAAASSILFALCHIQYGITGLAYTFVFGFFLSAVRWKTGSVYPCIAVHALNNLLFCLSVQFLPHRL